MHCRRQALSFLVGLSLTEEDCKRLVNPAAAASLWRPRSRGNMQPLCDTSRLCWFWPSTCTAWNAGIQCAWSVIVINRNWHFHGSGLHPSVQACTTAQGHAKAPPSVKIVHNSRVIERFKWRQQHLHWKSTGAFIFSSRGIIWLKEFDKWITKNYLLYCSFTVLILMRNRLIIFSKYYNIKWLNITV